MTRIGLAAIGAGGLVVLSACVQEPAPDPFAIACQERAAQSTGSGASEALAAQSGTDALGNRIYSVAAGGASFRCVVDEAAFVTQFSRL